MVEQDVVETGVNNFGLIGAKGLHDGDEDKHGEGEEEPLPAIADKGGNEASNNHEHVHEESANEIIIGGTSEVEHGVKKKGSGEHPVNVAGEKELAAITAASVVAVAGGHGKVGKRGDEANEAFSDERSRKEGTEASGDGVVFVRKVLVGDAVGEENPATEEKDAEGDPKGNTASGGDFVKAGVDGAAGLDHKLTVQARLLLLFAAVGLGGGSVGRLFVVGSFVGGGSVVNACNATARGEVEERGVAWARGDAALRGSNVSGGGRSSV